MAPRRVWAYAVCVVHAHLRGPLLGVIFVAFMAAGAALPLVGEVASEDRLRSHASMVISTAGILLLLLAAGLPFVSTSDRRRPAPGALGRRGQALGALVGHSLVLVLTACMLGLGSLLLVTVSVGWPADPKGAVLGRELLVDGPSSSMALSAPNDVLRLSWPAEDAPRGVTLRLTPRVFLVRSEAMAPSGALRVPLRVRWAWRGERWAHRQIHLDRGRAVEEKLGLLERIGKGPLVIEVRRGGSGVGAQFERGDARLIGARTGAVGGILRATFAQALAALSLLAFTQWISGFVAFPLAVSASLTMALASSFAWNWLPGPPILDPTLRLLDGVAIGWIDLAADASRGGAWGLLAALGAIRAPLREGVS